MAGKQRTSVVTQGRQVAIVGHPRCIERPRKMACDPERRCRAERAQNRVDFGQPRDDLVGSLDDLPPPGETRIIDGPELKLCSCQQAADGAGRRREAVASG